MLSSATLTLRTADRNPFSATLILTIHLEDVWEARAVSVNPRRPPTHPLAISARRGACILAFVLIAAAAVPIQSESGPAASRPVPVITSPEVPIDVDIPFGFAGNPIAFFDDFSWRSFIALVWPAQDGQRGVADTKRPVGALDGPLVFETYKADWEVFQPNGEPPSAWDSFDAITPCPDLQKVGFADLILVSFSKFGNLCEAGFGNLVGPIIAQNQTYLRYLTGFNKIEFDQIFDRQLFLSKNLTFITFPNNALDVKSAWIDMTNIKHPERYYTRTAYVVDLGTDGSSAKCSKRTVGLVGLHIVQKTKTRPQWIWSTFEQIDNVPPGAGPFALNDESGKPMPDKPPFEKCEPPVPVPTPFNVDRKLPIHESTLATNSAYQDALKGTVWQFYQLVMTQWPVATPPNPALPGTPKNTFPGTGATSAFANVTMETFDQQRIRTGCMNCHTLTQQNSDFVWSLPINAFSPPAPIRKLMAREGPKIDALRKLKELMAGAFSDAEH